MIFESSMGPRKSMCDVFNGTIQRSDCLATFVFYEIILVRLRKMNIVTEP
jgi:hypothetical protein